MRASRGHVLRAHLGALAFAALITLIWAREALKLGRPGEATNAVAATILVGGMWLWALYSAASVVVNRLRLTADRVERRTILGERSYRRADIVGVREWGNGILLCTDLKLHNGLGVPVKVLEHPVWAAWIDTLLNLDQQDLVDAQARDEADPALGRNLDERRDRIAFLNRVSRFLVFGELAVLGWVLFWPRPYELAIVVLGAMPLIAGLVALRWPKLANHVQALFGAVLLPIPILCLRVMYDLEVLDPWPIGLWACVPALVAGLAAARFAKPQNVSAAVVVGVLGGLLAYGWAWGVLSFADVLPDQSAPRKIRTVVLERADDKQGVELTLRGLDPPREVFNEISASKREAKGVRVDDTVCLAVHRGWLGWRWAYLTDC